MSTRTIPAVHVGGRRFEVTQDIRVPEGARIEVVIEEMEAPMARRTATTEAPLPVRRLGLRRLPTREELYDELI